MINKIIFHYLHENNEIPQYLKDNMEFTKKYNIPIELITSGKNYDFEYYSKNTENENPLWKSSILRFFHIRDHMKQHNLKNVLYLEGDVLLLENPKSFEKYFMRNKINYPCDAFNRGMASIMYIPHYRILSEFCNFIIQNTLPLNDMNLLGLYGNRHSLNINPKYEIIFDAGAIGQMLDGTHLNPGVPFENETCYIKYKDFDLSKNKIINVHIHSKRISKIIEMYESGTLKQKLINNCIKLK